MRRSLRIQIMAVVMIAFLTLPWLFSDIRVVQPRLILPEDQAAEGQELPTLPATLFGASRRSLRINAGFKPLLIPSQNTVVKIVSDTAAGPETLFNPQIFRHRDGRKPFDTQFTAMLPNHVAVAAVDGQPLTVTVMIDETPICRFAGRLDLQDRRLIVTDHPFIGDRPRSETVAP